MKYYIIPNVNKEDYKYSFEYIKVLPIEIENGDYILPENINELVDYNIDLTPLELKEGNEITFKNYNYDLDV